MFKTAIMDKIDTLFSKWQSLQPLDAHKQYLLSQRFTVDGSWYVFATQSI